VNLHWLIVIRKDARPVFSSAWWPDALEWSATIGMSAQTTQGGEDMESVLLDAAGHRRSPATMPVYHQGRAPRNKGLRYPADPPTIEEIVAVMRAAGDGPDGARLRALVVMLWRAGLRISEALDLAETDLDRSRGAVVVRRGLCRIRHSPCRTSRAPWPLSRSVSWRASASLIRSPARHSRTISARSR
jgi:integrase